MRIVIAVVGVTLFVLWEQIYNDWALTRGFVAEISRVMHQIGL